MSVAGGVKNLGTTAGRRNIFLGLAQKEKTWKRSKKAGAGRKAGSPGSTAETRAGVIAYYFNGEKLGELPVTAAEAVERAGYKDHLQKVFKSWISIRRTAA